MKNVKKLVSLALTGMLIASFTGCNMITKTKEGIRNSVVAKVNGHKITRGQVDDRLEGVLSSLEKKYGDDYEKLPDVKKYLKSQRMQTLDEMIANVIIEDKGTEFKIIPSEEKLKEDMKKERERIKEETNKQVDSLKKLYKNEEDFNKYLKLRNVTEKELREPKGITDDLVRANVINKIVYDNITKNVTVTDKDVKDYYEANKESFQEGENKVHIAHILVKTKEESDKIKKELDEGKDFANIAKEKSLDVATKDKGGDLGWINYKDMKQGMVFMLAAKTMNKGEVSQPIKEKDGWHILKVIDKKIYTPKPFDDVKDNIKKVLINQKKNKLWQDSFSKWKKEAKVKKYEGNI